MKYIVKLCESNGGGMGKAEKVGRETWFSRRHGQEGSSFKTKRTEESARERGKRRDWRLSL